MEEIYGKIFLFFFNGFDFFIFFYNDFCLILIIYLFF